MSKPTEPRPPAARLEPDTVLANPATVGDCKDDYAQRNTDTPERITAQPHTFGRKR